MKVVDFWIEHALGYVGSESRGIAPSHDEASHLTFSERFEAFVVAGRVQQGVVLLDDVLRYRTDLALVDVEFELAFLEQSVQLGERVFTFWTTLKSMVPAWSRILLCDSGVRVW